MMMPRYPARLLPRLQRLVTVLFLTGMAAIFLMPLLRPALQSSALLNCTLIHLGLVAFRTAGFILFSDIQTMTMKLAAGEWVILILSGLLLWKAPKGKR